MKGLMQERVDALIRNWIEDQFGKSPLFPAIESVLMSPGKRFRPGLVLHIADELSFSADVSFAALAVECFHTASLIVDDLPCMDDEAFRRGKPALHRAFGESTALLVSLGLIAEGYGLIAKNVRVLQKQNLKHSLDAERLGMLALENVAKNSGFSGAISGQFADLEAKNLNLATLQRIIHQKTSALFEMSFVFGWLFGGGDLALLPEVKKAASHFGMAFQIADDLDDMEEDLRIKRGANLANAFGVQTAKDILKREQDAFLSCLSKLKLGAAFFPSFSQ